MKNDPHDIILRPVITEHASELQGRENPQYVFEVRPGASKVDIRNAIESIFDVKVESVNTVNRKGKVKRVRLRAGKRADQKRAYVTLKSGQEIDLF
jgi:large subunit ribosomal protein L23